MSLRVTIVVPHLSPSGGLKIALMYADGLADQGHDVTVVAGSASEKPGAIRFLRGLFGRSPAAVQWPGAKVRLVFTEHHDEAMVADLPDADVLIATWWQTVEAVSAAPPAKGKKVHLVQDHEVFPYLPVDRVAAAYRLPFHKIVVSNWLFAVMRDTYGIADISLIPNPADLSRFPRMARSRASPPKVGTVYSAAPRKNSGMAVEAVRIARDTIPELTLVCFGADLPPKAIRREPFVDFHLSPEQHLIPQLYAACDFWLFTSDSEGFGLPILEAMAAGTPVIATSAGAAPDLITAQTGVLVAKDPSAMADAIVRMMGTTAEHWREMSDHCRSVAEAHDVESALRAMAATLTRVAVS